MLKDIFKKIFPSFFGIILFFIVLVSNASAISLPQYIAEENSKDPNFVTTCRQIQGGNSAKAICTKIDRLNQKIVSQLIFTKNPQTGQYENAQTPEQINKQAVDQNNKKSENSCGFFNIADCIVLVLDWTLYFLIAAVNFLLRQILWVASIILDASIYYTIVKFKSNFSDLKVFGVGSIIFGSTSGDLIYYLWGMIRDFLNIIIFITVVYAAVQSMFEGFANTRRKFIGLLVFSIVMNFSLLFVKLAIDISNILALQAYTLVVKPSGTETFLEFTTSASSPKSYAEYIMGAVSLSNLLMDNRTSEQVKQEIQNQNSTFLAELGKMIVYIGLIYLFFLFASALLTRAISFMLAMIMSPLLAVQVFFGFWKTSSSMNDILKSLEGITSKIQGDFYEGLIKGPALIFFLFLIGVLAESIFSQGIIKDFQNTVSSSANSQLMPSSFTTSLFVLSKFAVFFALSIFLLKTLEKIKFTKGFASSAGNFIAGRVFGGAAGFGGFVGRRVIGQGLASGRLGKTLSNGLSSMAQSKSVFGRLVGNNIGNSGIKAINSLKVSNFDARDSKTFSAIGRNISGAAGVDLSKTIGGGPKEQGFDAIKAKQLADAETRRNEYIKTAQSGVSLTKEEEKNIEKEQKVKVNGEDRDVSDLAEALKKLTKSDGTIDKNATVKTVKGNTYNGDDNFFKKEKNGISQADTEMAKAKESIEKAKADKVKSKAKEVEEKIRRQIAEKTGPKFFGELAERMTPKAISGTNIEDDLAKKQKDAYIQDNKKKGKDRANALKFIQGDVGNSVEDIIKLTKKFNLPDNKADNPIYEELKTLEEFSKNYDEYTNPTTGPDKFHKIAEKLFDAKETIVSKLSEINRLRAKSEAFGRMSPSDIGFTENNKKVLGKLKSSVDSLKKTYQNYKPKDQSSSKDNKAGKTETKDGK